MSKSNGKRSTHRGGRDWEWEVDAFIEAFMETASVSGACRELGIQRSSAYRRRQADEAFALAWADADEAITDALEEEAYRRAVKGVEEPRTVAGKEVAVKRFSDRLLEMMLKARRPEKYRERVEISGKLEEAAEKSKRKTEEELDSSLAGVD